MNESTFQILQIFASRTSLNLSQLEAILNRDLLEIAAPVAYLREQGYLKKVSYSVETGMGCSSDPISPTDMLQLTYEGRVALENEIKERKRFKYGEIRAWITAIIAVLAFMKSFFF